MLCTYLKFMRRFFQGALLKVYWLQCEFNFRPLRQEYRRLHILITKVEWWSLAMRCFSYSVKGVVRSRMRLSQRQNVVYISLKLRIYALQSEIELLLAGRGGACIWEGARWLVSHRHVCGHARNRWLERQRIQCLLLREGFLPSAGCVMLVGITRLSMSI